MLLLLAVVQVVAALNLYSTKELAALALMTAQFTVAEVGVMLFINKFVGVAQTELDKVVKVMVIGTLRTPS